ncbi:MAG: penicillin-binding transpeptidase domain-containing protein [Candidatus Brocadiales bacterium]
MYSTRLKIIFGLVLAAFTLLVIRLGYLQIFESAKYSGISKKRLLRDAPVPARRGNVYDRRGRPLAVEEPAFDIMVSYRNLRYAQLRSKGVLPPPLSKIKAHKDLSAGCDSCHSDTGLWVPKLAKLLDLTPRQLLSQTEEIINRVEKIKAHVQMRHKRTVRIQEEFAPHAMLRNAPIQKAAELEMHQDSYPGVSLRIRPKRYYPYRDTASHIIGHVGKPTREEIQDARFALIRGNGNDEELRYYMGLVSSPNQSVGRAGIEGYYNLELTGNPGRTVEEISLKTREVDKTIFDMPPSHGNDLFLTLDLDIQRLAEKLLGEKRGAIVVLDTYDGGVLAMASYPRFDANTLGADYNRLAKDPGKPLLNRPIQALLPPGSTFKIVTALTALSSGKIDLNTHFNCSGAVTLGEHRFRCNSVHGSVDLARGIEQSCNVFFFNTARRLNNRTMNEWARKFGFGSKTGVDLPYEASGSVPLPKYTGERLNTAIGQGELLVTPLQMAQLLATVANDGILLRPHLLKKIVTDAGVTVLEPETPEPQILEEISEEDLLAVKAALRQVVISGTARRKGLKELGVAGKTGTSQIGGTNKNHLWFVGYFPFDSPRYAFCITLERTTGHGGSVAAPIAHDLVSGILDIEQTNRKLAARENKLH